VAYRHFSIEMGGRFVEPNLTLIVCRWRAGCFDRQPSKKQSDFVFVPVNFRGAGAIRVSCQLGLGRDLFVLRNQCLDHGDSGVLLMGVLVRVARGGESEEPSSLFASSSEESVSVSDRVDDESLVARPRRLPEEEEEEEELEIECDLLADRCSKTPSPKF
jgi:hypothetical protein